MRGRKLELEASGNALEIKGAEMKRYNALPQKAAPGTGLLKNQNGARIRAARVFFRRNILDKTANDAAALSWIAQCLGSVPISFKSVRFSQEAASSLRDRGGRSCLNEGVPRASAPVPPRFFLARAACAT